MRKITFLLSLVLVFTIPWEDSVSATSLGSLTRVVGLAVAGCWLMTIVIEGRFRKPHLFHYLVLLFFLWNFLSVFWSRDMTSTIERLRTYAQVFLLILILWEILQKPEELVAALQAYVFGAYVLIGSTIYNYVNGNVAVAYEGRYSATGVNAVDLALILLLGLPVAAQLFFAGGQEKQGTVLRLINLSYIPLAIFSIVLTGSRTSLVAIIPFGAYMVVSPQIKFNQKLLLFILLLAALLVLLPFIPSTVLERLGTIGSSIASKDLDGRVKLWADSILLLSSHPILGIGAGTLYSTIGAAAHNTFISVATETGFVGFGLFIATLGLVVYQTMQLPGGKSGLWLVVLLTWAIGVLSLSWEFRKATWLLLSFVAIQGNLVTQPQAAPSSLPVSQKVGKPLGLPESEIKAKAAS